MTLDEAVDRLRAGSRAEREAALARIGEAGSPRLTPAVAPGLHDPDSALVDLTEATLWRIWSRSGDPRVDALFLDGLRALERRDWLGAVSGFTRVIETAPGFAEGWNKRATARYLAEHYASAIADCEEVLRLNPHHFGAASGQGLCHAALGQYRDAARCFRHALEIHPGLEGVRQNLSRVEQVLVRGNGS